MEKLVELRKEIDDIDIEIVRLFEKRMTVSEEIAGEKIRSGKKVFSKEREKEKLAKLENLPIDEFDRIAVEELFHQIMAMSRKRQYRLLTKMGVKGRLPFIEVEDVDRDHVCVVYQGVEGAYSHQAMHKFFGKNINSYHVGSFREAMGIIAEGSADYAVLPIENSTAGIVSENFDLLSGFENYIVGEQIISCEHALVGIPGTSLDQIKKVYSHPQAIAQCGNLLEAHEDWEAIPWPPEGPNTALSAKKVAEDGDPTKAALASKFAAERYGLEVLVDRAYSNEANSTRFIVVSNQRVFRKGANKISICFEVPHRSGSLYNMLSHIIFNNLNMLRIESRPILERNWDYRFFIDFEGNLNDESVKSAIRGIREEAINLKILGNY